MLILLLLLIYLLLLLLQLILLLLLQLLQQLYFTATDHTSTTIVRSITSLPLFVLLQGPRKKMPKNRNAFDEEDEDDEDIVFPRSSSTR